MWLEASALFSSINRDLFLCHLVNPAMDLSNLHSGSLNGGKVNESEHLYKLYIRNQELECVKRHRVNIHNKQNKLRGLSP
jgi:hypothetical protein